MAACVIEAGFHIFSLCVGIALLRIAQTVVEADLAVCVQVGFALQIVVIQIAVNHGGVAVPAGEGIAVRVEVILALCPRPAAGILAACDLIGGIERVGAQRLAVCPVIPDRAGLCAAEAVFDLLAGKALRPDGQRAVGGLVLPENDALVAVVFLRHAGIAGQSVDGLSLRVEELLPGEVQPSFIGVANRCIAQIVRHDRGALLVHIGQLHDLSLAVVRPSRGKVGGGFRLCLRKEQHTADCQQNQGDGFCLHGGLLHRSKLRRQQAGKHGQTARMGQL